MEFKGVVCGGEEEGAVFEVLLHGMLRPSVQIEFRCTLYSCLDSSAAHACLYVPTTAEWKQTMDTM